jgi:hypothetical protein
MYPTPRWQRSHGFWRASDLRAPLGKPSNRYRRSYAPLRMATVTPGPAKRVEETMESPAVHHEYTPAHGLYLNRPALPLVGGCLCAAIQYEIGAYPLFLYTCHCTDCQRQSGSAFAMNMRVPTETFRIVHGEPKGWRRRSPSGAETVSWFCADCGGRIYGCRASRPESVNVRAGSLDDTSWLIPGAHIFMRSAQRWINLPMACCYDAAPPDLGALAKPWRASGNPP